tara:strand:+ start:540 stop:1046 length:507 start_codon:yes stop_codon:yes gene_type:complete
MTVKVENNFLDNEFFWDICKIVTNNNFPWYIGDPHNDFIHNLIYETNLKKENSFYAPKIHDELSIKNIISSRLTLNLRSSSFEKTSIYSDNIDVNNKTLRGFLCITPNNAEINILGVNEVPLIENRFISFPKNNLYYISTHTDTKFRIVLEIIYKLTKQITKNVGIDK